MKESSVLVLVVMLGLVSCLQIGIKHRPETCTKRAGKGDRVHVHYTGKLEDGTEFDSSVGRAAFTFTLGAGQVIKGWDRGLAGACVGEKRRLRIPPELGYGDNGAPPKIPAKATLVFDIELLDVEKKGEL